MSSSTLSSIPLAKDTLVYGAGRVLLRATVLVTMPVFTRVFTPDDYGVWAVVVTSAGFVSAFLALGGDVAYTRFFFEAKTLHEKQLLTSTLFSFLLAWSWALVLVGVLLAHPISGVITDSSENGFLVVLALLAAPLTMINAMLGQVLRNEFRAVLYSALTFLTGFLLVSFSLFAVVVLDLGLAGAIGGTLVANLTVLPIRLWTARSMLRPLFSGKLLWRLLGFGVPLVPLGIAFSIFTASDRILLSRLADLEDVGLYSVAASVVGFLVMAHHGLGHAWSPHGIRAYEEHGEASSVFFGRVATYIVLGFGLLAVAISAFAREILMILATPEFYSAAVVVGPLALGTVAFASTHVTWLGLVLAKRTYFLSIYAWGAAAINVGLNVLTIPLWGMAAAAWTTLASYLFLTAAYWATSRRFVHVAYEKQRMFSLVAVTVPFCLAPPLLPELSLVLSIPLKAGYCAAYASSLFLTGVVKKRDLMAARAFIAPLIPQSKVPAGERG